MSKFAHFIEYEDLITEGLKALNSPSSKGVVINIALYSGSLENVHRSPTRRVLSGTGLELMTRRPRSNALAPRLPWTVKSPSKMIVYNNKAFAMLNNSYLSKSSCGAYCAS
ncbi:hypothetical protein TNCV_4659721 [Trichonephila clavipes]|uniref:Uncharacterized protein n=1 Tax=Trichonephila clavipes TaxID=2585209 RepID=A0A8X6VDN4_TRICX|nr:hypothetical protein TNCV_4659721 [Trichonephila clavipes]